MLNSLNSKLTKDQFDYIFAFWSLIGSRLISQINLETINEEEMEFLIFLQCYDRKKHWKIHRSSRISPNTNICNLEHLLKIAITCSDPFSMSASRLIIHGRICLRWTNQSLAVSNVKHMRNCTDEVACETGEITPGACIPAAACFVYEAFVSREW